MRAKVSESGNGFLMVSRRPEDGGPTIQLPAAGFAAAPFVLREQYMHAVASLLSARTEAIKAYANKCGSELCRNCVTSLRNRRDEDVQYETARNCCRCYRPSMLKVASAHPRPDRIHGTSATLDELYEQTRLLHAAIVAEARRVRAAARLAKHPKRIVPHRP